MADRWNDCVQYRIKNDELWQLFIVRTFNRTTTPIMGILLIKYTEYKNG